jgi:mono/diheme cytochrome c family protein
MSVAKNIDRLIYSALLFSFCLSDEAWAQRRVSRGHDLALQICAECHAVERKPAPSPHGDAPSFRTIARRPYMTADFLSVEIRRAHVMMPTMTLSPEDLRAVIAYIRSLRR